MDSTVPVAVSVLVAIEPPASLAFAPINTNCTKLFVHAAPPSTLFHVSATAAAIAHSSFCAVDAVVPVEREVTAVSLPALFADTSNGVAVSPLISATHKVPICAVVHVHVIPVSPPSATLKATPPDTLVWLLL